MLVHRRGNHQMFVMAFSAKFCARRGAHKRPAALLASSSSTIQAASEALSSARRSAPLDISYGNGGDTPWMRARGWFFSMGFHGDLMEINGISWGFHGDLMEINENSWGFDGNQWEFMGFHGDFMGIWWKSMGIHGDFMRIWQFSLGFTGILWGCYWVSWGTHGDLVKIVGIQWSLMGYVANGYPVTIGSKLMVGIDIFLWNSIMFIPISCLLMKLQKTM